MDIEFDPDKDAINRKKHNGISLALASDLDWDEAFAWRDDRFPYDELRMRAIVPLGDVLYHIAYVDDEDVPRPISLRTATRQEHDKYVRNY
ncbi:hypothetical protein AGMMS49960_00630 [Betaproteobacteria bacterium]|nr:hypothetical protein AGMMS49543_07030 [Betaproteobacteria bacterium]GHT98139.1 hypothetical protein AGMMS49960_00630 [Betaproteobacteria bacterium]